MKKEKVLFILHMPPPVHGAAMVGKYIHDSELVNSKFECKFINLAMAGSLEDVGRFSLYKLKLLATLLNKVRKEVKNFKPDLVYVTPNAKGGAFFKEFVIVQVLKSMGCKVVVHYHNKGVSTKQDEWLYNLLYKRFFKDLKVILLGKSLYQDINKYVKWEDVYICPNGIPEGVRNKKEVVKGENSLPRLLFLSNLIESKGVIVLLDALKILKDKGYSFVCDFVGGETAEIDAKRFEEEVQKRGLNELTVYQGKKFGDEKNEEIDGCDIFVLPTRNDCFPLVLLEAMMHGKPVVTTPIGAIPDIIDDGENGIIDKEGSAQSLSECIKTLIENKQLRAEYGENGRKKYMVKFTDTQFEKMFTDTLKSVVGGGGSLVRYLGKKYDGEKERVFNEAEIFVFPTYYDNECFPLVLLEAMEHGLPCVTTAEGAICDIIEDGVNGFVAKHKDANSLAEKIKLLLDDKEKCQRMGEKGYKIFKDSFTIDAFENRICDILQDLT